MIQIMAALLGCLLLCSCATNHGYHQDDPRSAQVWTPSQVGEEMAGRDPIEPFNRAMFTVNDLGIEIDIVEIGIAAGQRLRDMGEDDPAVDPDHRRNYPVRGQGNVFCHRGEILDRREICRRQEH